MFSTTVGHNILWKKPHQNMTMLSSTLVRWLNRGAALSGLFHPGNGIDIFTIKQGKTIPWLFDKKCVMALAFTVHATKLNEINTYFQSLDLPPH